MWWAVISAVYNVSSAMTRVLVPNSKFPFSLSPSPSDCRSESCSWYGFSCYLLFQTVSSLQMVPINTCTPAALWPWRSCSSQQAGKCLISLRQNLPWFHTTDVEPPQTQLWSPPPPDPSHTADMLVWTYPWFGETFYSAIWAEYRQRASPTCHQHEGSTHTNPHDRFYRLIPAFIREYHTVD